MNAWEILLIEKLDALNGILLFIIVFLIICSVVLSLITYFSDYDGVCLLVIIGIVLFVCVTLFELIPSKKSYFNALKRAACQEVLDGQKCFNEFDEKIKHIFSK